MSDLALIPTQELADELMNRYDRCVFIMQDKAAKTGSAEMIVMYVSPPDHTMVHGLLAQAQILATHKSQGFNTRPEAF